MYFTNRTDLALEFSRKSKENKVGHRVYRLYDTEITETELSEQAGRELGKPQGRYYTIYSDKIPETKNEIYALSAVLRKILPHGKCLVVGLGNPKIAADSLGWQTAGKILATSEYVETTENTEGIGNVSVMRPDVTANSGIDSAFQTQFSSKAINADYIIAIDSLACEKPERLCRTIQITDTGICPGSGAGNPRKRLDKASAGIPVIAIGVPTSMEYFRSNCNYFVTKHDIDADVRRYAHVISSAINRTLSPALSQDDIRLLMNYA